MRFGFDRPEWSHQYRDQTTRHKAMSGVSSTYTFMCKKCRQPKKIGGRKKLAGGGFACCDCVTASQG